MLLLLLLLLVLFCNGDEQLMLPKGSTFYTEPLKKLTLRFLCIRVSRNVPGKHDSIDRLTKKTVTTMASADPTGSSGEVLPYFQVKTATTTKTKQALYPCISQPLDVGRPLATQRGHDLDKVDLFGSRQFSRRDSAEIQCLAMFQAGRGMNISILKQREWVWIVLQHPRHAPFVISRIYQDP